MIKPYLPHRFFDSMMRWIEHGVKPGSFLSAVLSNDLSESFACADAMSVHELPGIVSWLYNDAPRVCWGSPERMATWQQSHVDGNAKEIAVQWRLDYLCRLRRKLEVDMAADAMRGDNDE